MTATPSQTAIERLRHATRNLSTVATDYVDETMTRQRPAARLLIAAQLCEAIRAAEAALDELRRAETS